MLFRDYLSAFLDGLFAPLLVALGETLALDDTFAPVFATCPLTAGFLELFFGDTFLGDTPLGETPRGDTPLAGAARPFEPASISAL